MPAFEDGTDDFTPELPWDKEKNPSTKDLSDAMDVPPPRNVPMSETLMRLDYKASQTMSDIATRYEHLSQLLVLWEDVVEAMGRRSFLGRDELFKKNGIELAIKQLKKTMEGMEGYYTHTNDIRRMLQQIPKPFAVFGGRGTPIKPYEPLGTSTEDMT
jgi:hypothetical protein